MAYNQFNALPDNPNALAQFAPKQKTTQTKPKGPGGLKGFLINSLPAIGGGLGAVAGIPGDLFSAGASSVAGGAVGAAGGEALKQRLLGESLSPKQIGIQAAEGGATGAIGGIAKGGQTVAKSLSKLGLKGAEDVPETANAVQKAGGFKANLRTQGQQMQGRTAGLNAGTAGKEVVTPQDTERMLGTLSDHGIKTGNANNILRDMQTKMNTYGKQIGEHFTGNNVPLSEGAKKGISGGFLDNLPSSNPTLVKQAKILATDFENQVQDSKGMWEFRKKLDSQIPDTKFLDNTGSKEVQANKAFRQYLSDQLGSAPGMKEYHELSGLKPLVAREANRLNNPSGGVLGRIAASGPVQKTENSLGKGLEKISGGSAKVDKNIPADVVKTPDSILGSLTGIAKNTATLPIRAPATAIAHPLKSAGAVGVQGLLRGLGGAKAPEQVQADNGTSNIANTLTTPSTDQSEEDANNPFGQQSIQQAVLQDLQSNSGKNVSTLLSLYNAFGKPDASSTTPSVNKPTAQQYGLATTGISSLNQLAQMIEQDPSVLDKNATPGQGIPLVGSLISNAAGASGYHALADSILSSLIHLQTGATATKEEVTAAHGQLPQPGDPPDVRKQKLQTLINNFQPFLGTTGSSNNLQDLLGT